MEKLRVPALNCIAGDTALNEISEGLDKMNRYAIEQIPWSGFPYKPEVSFTIAYTADAILLKYFVNENYIRVTCHKDNGPVYEDSCVEFFIAFDDDEKYYNLEFNCIGTCLFGYGKNRWERQLIGKPLINKIRRQGIMESASNEKGSSVNWELVLVIPLEIFIHHRIASLKNRLCKVNFYKCGDKLPEPHFLAWKDMAADTPDFHLPEFFGSMQFV